MHNAQTRRHATTLADGQSPSLTAIVGVTPMARLYRNLLASDIDRSAREQIAGLIVLDRHFLHSYCFGMKVLGHLDDLGTIIQAQRIVKVVVTKPLSEEESTHLRELCTSHNLRLVDFGCHETPIA